jgi:trehalose 6-phosphate synthase/phosphatase
MGAETKGPAIVALSNRLPVQIRTRKGTPQVERAPGGLVSALGPALASRGGAWVGWPGAPLPPDIKLGEGFDFELVPVPLSQTEVRRFYSGFNNGTLWPLLHSFPTRMQIDRKAWAVYEEVNARFAERALEVAADGALFWVHDYQLLRVAPHLRAARPDARIAFFLHVPFPHYDVFRILPWDRDMLRALLDCDLIAFHCKGYAQNFLDCVERLLGERVDRETGKVEHGQRTVTVAAFPLGIDWERQRDWALGASRRDRGAEKIVLGVDRLDYTKGLPERIQAQRLKREVDELVGRVNGRFATSRWTPIRYLHRSVKPEDLAGMYRDADVALVTPLRDGMNLVAKEFVISQVDEPGVLVLSHLAGAAESMREALQVNPYDADQVAEALHLALTMDTTGRRARMSPLQKRERKRDVHAWVDQNLGTVTAPQVPIRPLEAEDFRAWLDEFLQGKRLALFLDFDGTLAQIVDHPKDARMSGPMHEALLRCQARPDTEISIVSGRSLQDLGTVIETPDLVLVGNHGLEIDGPGMEHFVHPDLPHFEPRLKELAATLMKGAPKGVWVEEKGASLTLHYRAAVSRLHAQIAARAHETVRDAGFQARDAICAVEARAPTGWDKGQAVLHVLRLRHGPAWSEDLRAVYVGDDETDEDAFRALQGLGITFCVGRAERPTLASHRLPDVPAVETLLRWVAGR